MHWLADWGGWFYSSFWRKSTQKCDFLTLRTSFFVWRLLCHPFHLSAPGEVIISVYFPAEVDLCHLSGTFSMKTHLQNNTARNCKIIVAKTSTDIFFIYFFFCRKRHFICNNSIISCGWIELWLLMLGLQFGNVLLPKTNINKLTAWSDCHCCSKNNTGCQGVMTMFCLL